ncbi:MAG TPA: efflux RND transporter permease subunit, partial [Chloroflexota bacterium]|nr:efflux RND transporter permease subunit [Chloroflexota bacterium]
MGLTRVAILRPLFIAMVILAMVVVGVVSYTRLGVDLYPNVDFPVTSVVTVYPGADPETVEQLVTKPIENAVAGLSGVDYIQSYSSEGISYVVVVFKDGVDGNTASIDVQRQVSSLRGAFPVDAQDPSIVKADINAMPVMNLSLSGPAGAGDLYTLADQTISPQLSNVPGVSSVSIVGGLQREIHVQVNSAKLRAYGLSILQVTNALGSENVNIPSGSVTQDPLDYQVRLNAQVQDPGQL